ncbi:MAG: hypothetical protein MK142_00535, partial [Pseudomonadales bacterium]|nr:hypothetical protein [Pseudomonadales bacterium]
LSLLVVLGALVCQRRYQPFLYRKQNALEELLLCLHGLLLSLGWVSDGMDAPPYGVQQARKSAAPGRKVYSAEAELQPREDAIPWNSLS